MPISSPPIGISESRHWYGLEHVPQFGKPRCSRAARPIIGGMGEPRAAARRFPLQSYTVVVVDNYTTTRDRTKALLSWTEFRVIGEEADGLAAVKLCADVRPDILLIALGLPRITGIEAIKAIRRRSRETLSVVQTIYTDDESAISAICAGARGFIDKAASDTELLYGLRHVIHGGTYVSREVGDRLRRRFENVSLTDLLKRR